MSNKKKAAAIGVVNAIVENNITNTCTPLPSAWNQQGKQTIMANRNAMQMRYIRKNK